MNKTLDLRALPAGERQSCLETQLPLIEAGEELILLADQDPTPLFQKFDSSKLVRPLQAKELEAGPTLWRILIQAPDGDGEGHSCCGSCGG